MIGVVLGTGWEYDPRWGVEVVRRRHPEKLGPPQMASEAICQWSVRRFDTVILTNAAGATNPDLEVGEVVCISDHVNLTGLPATSLFATMAGIYTCVDGFRTGVYAQVPGPAFETPAEARMLRTIGADMVGMSTALEAGQAHELGMRVVGLSFISDVAGTSAGHDDVLAAAGKADLRGVLDRVIGGLT
jgi:purine-nucleoside phosphorylase